MLKIINRKLIIIELATEVHMVTTNWTTVKLGNCSEYTKYKVLNHC